MAAVFLGFVDQVVKDTKNLLDFTDKTDVSINGEEIFNAFVRAGADIVVLGGNHKTANYDAEVVINEVGDRTLDRNQIFNENPAFLWDAWATTNQRVLDTFNKLSGNPLTNDQFLKMQAAVHLITGLHLNAIELSTLGNVVVLKVLNVFKARILLFILLFKITGKRFFENLF